jgi:flagellar hook-associated protein 2
MTVSSLGIGSGLDLQGLLDGLMQVEATQQRQLKAKVTARQSEISTYQALNTRFSAVRTAAEALNLGSQWKVNKATSSDPSVTASASSSAISGNFSFSVTKLATANVLASSQTVSGLDSVVASGKGLVGSFGPIGLTSVTASNDFADGEHTIEVTQAAKGATATGTATAGTTVIGPSNNTIEVDINGSARTLTLAEGTYNRTQLAQAITDASNGDLKASVGSDNSISIATTRQGSAASLELTGGSALSAVGHTASGALSGTDGIIEVDGVANTITDTSGPVTLNGTNGSITASFSATGMKTGSVDFDAVDYGAGTLSDVVNKINSARGPMSAAAVQVAPGQYKLQLTAKESGVENALSIDRNAFASMGLGTMETVTEAQNAEIKVGSGAGGYTITSASNAVKDALPGVTLNLTEANPAKTITVSVGGDVAAISKKVEDLVKAANDAAVYIRTNSKYDAGASKAGALLGDPVASQLQQRLFTEALSPVAGTDLRGMDSVGIKSGPDGTITFDKAKFEEAYAANPEAVAEMFVNGGTTSVQDPAKGKGFAERLAELGRTATNSVDGLITNAIKGVNTRIDDLNSQIERWDDRLEQRRQNLQRQFTALDIAVSNSQQMQGWLSGQIGKLQ